MHFIITLLFYAKVFRDTTPIEFIKVMEQSFENINGGEPVLSVLIPLDISNEKKCKNSGTGAGGANTNIFGKRFEEKTNHYNRLLNEGYVQQCFAKTAKKTNHKMLSKSRDDKTTIFVQQGGFKLYMKQKYNVELFRFPDEAYLTEYDTPRGGKTVIKILEKKEQNVEGSVETKLWSGPALKREYEIMLGDRFEVHYGFCVSDFLKKKMISNEPKYVVLNTILREHNIDVLFGDDDNYFETLDNWLAV